MAIGMESNIAVTAIKLNYASWPGFPEGTEIIVTKRPDTMGFVATIPIIGATIEISSTCQREAMKELADNARVLSNNRLRGRIPGADRHDRGWPKVATA